MSLSICDPLSGDGVLFAFSPTIPLMAPHSDQDRLLIALIYHKKPGKNVMNALKFKPKLTKRIKNELKFRELMVKNKQIVAGCFYRIVFYSEQMADFSSYGFDDHVKVFFPEKGSKCILPQVTAEGITWPEGSRPVSRDYTPLAFDAQNNELTIDFYIHDGGIASSWAATAKAGDTLMIGGPRGSLVTPTDYGWQLYICDESGLPAVRRRLQSLSDSVKTYVMVNSHHTQTHPYLSEFTHAQIEWLDFESLTKRLENITIPAEDYFVWITGEGEEVKCLSDYIHTGHDLDTDYLCAVAYWHKK